MAESVVFDCEGCGVEVVAFGITRPPADGFCSVCGWLDEFAEDADAFWRMYSHLQGWQPAERPQRMVTHRARRRAG